MPTAICDNEKYSCPLFQRANDYNDAECGISETRVEEMNGVKYEIPTTKIVEMPDVQHGWQYVCHDCPLVSIETRTGRILPRALDGQPVQPDTVIVKRTDLDTVISLIGVAYDDGTFDEQEQATLDKLFNLIG
jgi:hypothetical protein